ncbi:uncharacterized protein LOC115884823 [Sitophilus oryzae]|uniref:Uncharacterized protein LOC115884823 n=1 Tax=Sitophilus oryzae TaxID=7048 RepID=A0A6J2Y842_SITOR|nr:uncharacterized protein LOC115884823 [Sitophilus oryzae]
MLNYILLLTIFLFLVTNNVKSDSIGNNNDVNTTICPEKLKKQQNPRAKRQVYSYSALADLISSSSKPSLATSTSNYANNYQIPNNYQITANSGVKSDPVRSSSSNLGSSYVKSYQQPKNPAISYQNSYQNSNNQYLTRHYPNGQAYQQYYQQNPQIQNNFYRKTYENGAKSYGGIRNENVYSRNKVANRRQFQNAPVSTARPTRKNTIKRKFRPMPVFA